MIPGYENKNIKNVLLYNKLFFMDFKVWLFILESCKYLYPPVNLYWLFWLHWNEIFIPQMLSRVAIHYSY